MLLQPCHDQKVWNFIKRRTIKFYQVFAKKHETVQRDLIRSDFQDLL